MPTSLILYTAIKLPIDIYMYIIHVYNNVHVDIMISAWFFMAVYAPQKLATGVTYTYIKTNVPNCFQPVSAYTDAITASCTIHPHDLGHLDEHANYSQQVIENWAYLRPNSTVHSTKVLFVTAASPVCTATAKKRKRISHPISD